MTNLLNEVFNKRIVFLINTTYKKNLENLPIALKKRYCFFLEGQSRTGK